MALARPFSLCPRLSVSSPDPHLSHTRRRVTLWATDRRAVLLLLDEGQHAGEDARAHHQVLLLLHVRVEDPQHHRQQDAPRLCQRGKRAT